MTASVAHSGAACQLSPKQHAGWYQPPAVALVEFRGGAVRVELCQPCLIALLDHADDFPRWEPTYLAWIFDPRRLYCILHQWPAELCVGWVHNGRSRPDPKGP